jgi:DNA-binding response OmpR family regulator
VTPEGPSVAVLGDDLIWSTRLADAVSAAGGTPKRVRRLPDLEAALEAGARLVIIDLTALAYDGVAAIERATGAGARVLAVGQHDDLDLRRRALAAGAERVLAYRKLFEDGPATVAGWFAGAPRTKLTGVPRTNVPS